MSCSNIVTDVMAPASSAKVSGWVIVDKPSGIPSMAITSKIRRLFPKGTKAGHAGTLDPMASGILPIALGSATSLIPFLLEQPKTYIFTVQWGTSTTTEDAMGEVNGTSSARPSEHAIRAVLPQFTGSIQQIPPSYSALKVAGVPAYTRARRGEIVTLPLRTITIHTLDLVQAESEWAQFQAVCSSGTYVRSLGRDLAIALGTLGHVSFLRRTQVGPFYENHARGLDFFQKIEDKERSEVLLPPSEAVGFVFRLSLSSEQKEALHHGRFILWEGAEDRPVVACYYANDLVALASTEGGVLKPFKCFMA